MQKKKSSKELLMESAVELISKYPIDRVTVGEICDNAGISQRTFYNYFKDKHDLITWIYTSLLDSPQMSQNSSLSFHDYISILVENICKHGAFYVNVIRYTGQNNFRASIYEPMRKAAVSLITDVYGDSMTQEMSDSIDMYLFGCIGYMEYHLLHEDVVPAEITIPIFEKNMPALLKKYL